MIAVPNWKTIVALSLFAGFVSEEEVETPGCVLCGQRDKSPTGECASCGVYDCKTCGEMHFGKATRSCPRSGKV